MKLTTNHYCFYTLFFIMLSISFISCKDKKETAKSNDIMLDHENEVKKDSTEKIFLSTFDYSSVQENKLMAESGCLCSHHLGNSENFIFADDRQANGMAKINGAIIYFKSVKDETTDGVVYKKYASEKYSIEIKGSQTIIPKSDSGSGIEGTLTVFDKMNNILYSQKIKSSCAC